MNRTLTLSILLWTVFLITGNVHAQTAVQPSGSGTVEDPYQVVTLNNLYWITQNSSSWDKHFLQTADIDASSTAGWDGGAGLSPIGNSIVPFTGTYNGQGGTISGLTINRPNSIMIGLFGVIINGTVKNLGLVSVNINAYYYSGGIAGYVLGDSDLEWCYTSGALTGQDFLGGITGAAENGASLTKCATVASVSGSRYTGGFTGRNEGVVNDCYSAGSVSGTTITGGFAGQNAGSITNSFWDTETSGQASSAGGTGKTTAEMKNLATYTNLATPGLAEAWDFIGTPHDDADTLDLWNMDEALTLNSGYPLPSWWIVTTPPAGTGTQADPYQIASLNNLYWLMQQNGWGANIYYLQTADIPAYSTRYINFGKGFIPIGNTTNKFYGHYDGKDFLIKDLYINRLSDNLLDEFLGLFGFKQFGTLKNIHLSHPEISGYGKIGSLAGYVIDVDTIFNCSAENINLVFYRRETGGLIGVLISDANTVFFGCYATGSVSQSIPFYSGNTGGCGGLIGYIIRSAFPGILSIKNCYSNCNLTILNSNFSHTGGFIGVFGIEKENAIDFSDCYATGAINGKISTGGFLGSIVSYGNACQFDNCYSSGPVSGTTDVGGLIGFIDSSVPVFNACFWDIETSGQTTSAGGTGKTTAEMKTESTFTNAGWDFVNIWDMDPVQVINEGYPYHQWMNTAKKLDIKVFLEGPFNGTEMNTDIFGTLPLSQPYNTAPWNYTGTEAVTAIPNTDVVDWILVELRDAPDAVSATSATIVACQAAFLLKDGFIVSTDGQSILQFADLSIQQSLFAVVRHRNHIAVMSSVPLTETGGTYTYDFTTGAGQAYGNTLAHKQLAPGIWGMIAADGNADSQINNTDKIDIWGPQAGSGGYKSGDYNMNGEVNNTDKNDVWAPNTGLGGQVPD